MRAIIPYVNATLTQVGQPGSAPDYDAPGGSGTPRWTGSLGIYVSEDLHEIEAPGRVDEIIRTRVEIPAIPVGMLVQRGDALTYTNLETGVASTRVAEDVTRSPRVGRVRVMVEPG